MENARTELLEFLKEQNLVLKCARLEEVHYSKDNKKMFLLRTDHSKSDLEEFLEKIDFEYNSGYGSQELGGTLWFTDGTWADRSEYDGSEWWEYHKLPEIPKELSDAL